MQFAGFSEEEKRKQALALIYSFIPPRLPDDGLLEAGTLDNAGFRTETVKQELGVIQAILFDRWVVEDSFHI